MAKITSITEEVINHRPFTLGEADEFTFYIRQTIDRYASLATWGYLITEEEFKHDDFESTFAVKEFNPSLAEHVKYVECSLGSNLRMMVKFINSENKESFITANETHFNGITMGGLDDFNAETMPLIISAIFMMENGVLEMPFSYKFNRMALLPIHFYAELKLHFGSFDTEGCPSLDNSFDLLHALEIHPDLFSFRELTLLAGYKTERSIRNLASKPQSDPRYIRTTKQGRKTYIEHSEAVRWLNAHKKA